MGDKTIINMMRPEGRGRAAMGKTNWMRVFLGGLVAGIVLFVLGYAAWAIYLGKPWSAAIEALGHPYPSKVIVFQLPVGILAVWLYSAIRPRYGAGPKTAVIAGAGFWAMSALFANISLGFGGGCFQPAC